MHEWQQDIASGERRCHYSVDRTGPLDKAPLPSNLIHPREILLLTSPMHGTVSLFTHEHIYGATKMRKATATNPIYIFANWAQNEYILRFLFGWLDQGHLDCHSLAVKIFYEMLKIQIQSISQLKLIGPNCRLFIRPRRTVNSLHLLCARMEYLGHGTNVFIKMNFSGFYAVSKQKYDRNEIPFWIK